MHKKLSLGLKLGLIGNLLFILFALLAFIYYSVFDPDSKAVSILEKVTYLSLMSGFVCLAVSDIMLWLSVSEKYILKIGYAVYTLMEAMMMYFELNSLQFNSFYKPYSLSLAIVHSIVSAAVCFLFVYLDPYKTPYEVLVIICIGMILGGMFGNLMGIRIYYSILVNAVTFSALFAGIIIMIKREIIEIGCYGDSARVAEYRSVFFEEDDDSPQAAEPEKSPEPEKAPEPDAAPTADNTAEPDKAAENNKAPARKKQTTGKKNKK